MNTKKAGFLCLILVITILLLGICLENIRTRFLSRCVPDQKTGVYIPSSHLILSDGEACPQELLSARGQRCRTQESEQEQDTGQDYLSIHIYLLLIHKFFVIVERGQWEELPQQEIVVTYIHNTDGKKWKNRGEDFRLTG